jgi:localization factor PodJL
MADLMARQRKPLAIAACAVLLAIASWQMSKTFFAGAKVAAPVPAMQGTKVPEAKPAIESSKADTKPAAALPAAGEKPVRIVGTDAVPGNDPEPQSFKPLAKNGGQAPVETAKLQPREAADDARTDAISPGSSGDDLSATAPSNDKRAAIPAGPVPDADAGPVALRDAAASGDTVAMFEIASRYADGRNGQQDLKRAYDWYKQAAEAGFAPAQYRIGSMLEKGMGTAKDIKQAKTWYQMAAAQGNASAMHNLAVLFAMGADSAPDTQSAAEWFQKAAELGVKDSQYNLGILAANGDGMKQSLEESYKWFALAAKAGDKEASKKRDEVFKVLRPEQREKARVTTELWKPKALDPKTNNVEVPEEWRAAKDTTASVDVRKAIRNVQGILNKNGFDAGVADGVMGQKTINAIKAFQKANGLPVTGQVDHALVKALLAKN